jgi:hypothetical protein
MNKPGKLYLSTINKLGMLYLFMIILAVITGIVKDMIINDIRVRMGKFYDIGIDEIAITWYKTEKSGMHELGHFVNMKKGYVHGQRRFQELVDHYFPNLPGVGDTPMRKTEFGEWGGYEEAYAEIYAWWRLGWAELPPLLEPYFIESEE